MTTQKGKQQIDKLTNALQRLQVEYLPVDDVKPNEYNPNRQSTHEFDLLLKSIKEDGFTQPIIVMRDGNIIVDGEHRWRAAKALGYAEVPVVRVDMTDAQRKIATLRHNRARGTEDVNLTADLIKDLEKLGALQWAQDSLSLSDTEISRLTQDLSAAEALGTSESFEEAWVPTEFKDVATKVENTVASASPQAQVLYENQKQRIMLAKNEEERAMAQAATKHYTFTFNYAKDEHDLIHSVLGDQPAQKLLSICMTLSKEGKA